MERGMARTKIAIACQGGGSQTAFTAGALKALCDTVTREGCEIVSISGTSGGAICGALVWYAIEKDEYPAWGRLMRFWTDNTAQRWTEQGLNQFLVNSLRMSNSGLLPTFAFSPSSPLMQTMTELATVGQREVFRNFPALLRSHIDFDEIASWGARAKRPILILGAANVSTGKLAKFISSREPIRMEHILASCAVPNIFPAVPIGEDVYWDGLFSDNPPVSELVRADSVGDENLPDEIWLIKINPTTCPAAPVRPDEIVDRRNQLEGNISLFQQLRHLEMLNDMILLGAIRPEFLERFYVKAPIRIPKSFHTDADKPYHIPCIEMSTELQRTLDFESKLDRSASNINRLIAEGEARAWAFLKERRATLSASPRLEKEAIPRGA
jgi:NTE family protein